MEKRLSSDVKSAVQFFNNLNNEVVSDINPAKRSQKLSISDSENVTAIPKKPVPLVRKKLLTRPVESEHNCYKDSEDSEIKTNLFISTANTEIKNFSDINRNNLEQNHGIKTPDEVLKLPSKKSEVSNQFISTKSVIQNNLNHKNNIDRPSIKFRSETSQVHVHSRKQVTKSFSLNNNRPNQNETVKDDITQGKMVQNNKQVNDSKLKLVKDRGDARGDSKKFSSFKEQNFAERSAPPSIPPRNTAVIKHLNVQNLALRGEPNREQNLKAVKNLDEISNIKRLSVRVHPGTQNILTSYNTVSITKAKVKNIREDANMKIDNSRGVINATKVDVFEDTQGTNVFGDGNIKAKGLAGDKFIQELRCKLHNKTRDAPRPPALKRSVSDLVKSNLKSASIRLDRRGSFAEVKKNVAINDYHQEQSVMNNGAILHKARLQNSVDAEPLEVIKKSGVGPSKSGRGSFSKVAVKSSAPSFLEIISVSDVMQVFEHYKRPSTSVSSQNTFNDKRSDAFLEPYLQGLGDRQSPGVGAPSPSPPPACRIAPCLLPTPASRSPSRESLISSNGGSDAGSEDSTDTGYGAACDIGLVERLIRSHPIWFLPGIQRAGAFHLLQGKEEGCFVVRQSSQPDTMALSVRLPPDKGPYIEHYLIQSAGGRLGLETSENRFDNMPALIAHYANCCDELPVQITLPKAIREAKTRQQLSSLALLGQEFWRYSPPPSTASSPDADLVLNLNPLMSTFKKTEPLTPTSAEFPRPARPNTLNLINRIDPIRSEPKTESPRSTPSFNKNDPLSKIPPPPPPRWSKPTTPQNNFTVTTTVTFSVKPESPKPDLPSQVDLICDPKRMSPEGQCNSTLSSKDGSLRRMNDSIASPNGSILSPNSDPSSLLSPDTLSPLSVTKTARHSRRTKHKVSKHYQESDILESPTVYYRSAVGDKISDYEDLWTNDHTSFKPKNVNANNLASPDLLQHTQNVLSLNNNILSPSDSQTGSQHSHCSTPITHLQSSSLSQHSVQSPISDSPKTPALDLPSLLSPKQNSPFYAEPADSLAAIAAPRRLLGRNLIPMQHRHSNPPALHLHSAFNHGLDKMESSDFTGTISSSVDNLSPKQRLAALKRPDVKAVQPPLIKPRVNDTWQIDNSWKFMGSDCDINMDSSDPDYDSDWPSVPPLLPLSPHTPDPDDRMTVQELIADRFPDIRTSTEISVDEDFSRMSSYDNVEERRVPRPPPSEISEITEFSDPWTEASQGISNTETDDTLSENCNQFQQPRLASINRSKSFKDRLDPLLSAPRLQALRNREPGSRAVGAAIRQYALELAQDKSTTFAQNIDNFIACTCESKEINPQVVMRNMRQFMSGMKNYLVKHGERGFDKEVERERNKLKSTEFLNLDAILEGVLHRLVVRPLKSHLHKLFVDHYTKTGAIRLLADNIQYASTRPISELAVKPKLMLPSETALQTITQYLSRLQAADSPLEKLEYLLAAIATIFNSVKTSQLTGSGKPITLGADDFLPLFVWVLVKTNFVAAEIEAEYMWGLLHPSLLSGEGGYYLTTLSSAIHVLKNFKDSSEETAKSHIKTDSVLKVVVPDELHGSILTKTLPARPHMTTKEVCKIIAHKARITNPQDFALYRLVDGEETMLADNECPQDFMNEGKHVMLAYKRIDAKIAWPKQQSN